MAEQARSQGLVRFVSVTGHRDPDVLLRALAGHHFDSILLALNPAEVHRLSFQDRLLPQADRAGLGIAAMKVFGRGAVFRSIGSAEVALRYVLSLPVDVAVVGVDNVTQLERNAEIVSTFRPLSIEHMTALARATSSEEERINYYRRGSRSRAPEGTGGATY